MDPSKSQKTAALVLVTLAVFTDILVYGLIVPILPAYVSKMGFSQASIGLLFASYAVATLVATPLFGLICDRYGRRGPILFGLFGLAAATLLYAFASDIWLLFVARSLQGIAAAATWTAGLALLADLFPTSERGPAMGVALTGQSVGFLFGPVLGGWLYEWGGYALPFILSAGLVLGNGFFALFLLRNLPQAVNEVSPSLRSILANRKLMLVNGVVIFGAIIPAVIEPTLPLHLTNVFKATPGVVGLLFGVSTLVFALVSPLVGALSTRLGHHKTMSAGLALAAMSLPLLVLPQNIWLEVAALAFFGVGTAVVITPTLPQIAELSHNGAQNAYGTAYATFNFAYSLGMMLGPLSASLLAESFGLTVAYLTIGGGALVFLGIFIGGYRLAEKR